MFFENLRLDESNDFLDNNTIEITLTFISNNLNKNEITNLLKTEPTFAWNPNEIVEIGSSKRMKVAEVGKWYLKSVAQNDNLDLAIESFLQTFPNDTNIWFGLTKKYETFIEVTCYHCAWNNTYTISNKTLMLLANRNLSLSFDIYNMDIGGDNE
jgi:hypothetical protein